MEKLFGMFCEQTYREDLDRYRSLYVYRGMTNADFTLKTSLTRDCKQKAKSLEPSILSNFTKYAALEDPSIERSIWRQMILGQHHGLPTRLLDWSFSPLTGLHFSVTERFPDDTGKHDSAVWRLDVKELHRRLPARYQKVMAEHLSTVFSVDMLGEVCESLDQYDTDREGKAFVILEPPSIDRRIVNQYSFFSVMPHGMDDIQAFLDENTQNTVKYVIKKELRWQVRDMLDQLNINERIIYPGLDGISRWLARHYFVKGTDQGNTAEDGYGPTPG